MSVGKRLKVQGSTFEVQTGLGTPIPITAITLADPPEVTASNSLTLGAVIKVTGAMAGLDGNLYVIDNADATGFELVGADSTNYTAFVLDSPNLARATPVVFTTFCELTSINSQGGSADEIEVTSICSTSKEFEIGLRDAGSLSLEMNFAPNEAVQAALRASQADSSPLAYRITFPGDGGIVIVTGFVQSLSFSGAVNGVWTASATIKLTGDLAVLAAA